MTLLRNWVTTPKAILIVSTDWRRYACLPLPLNNGSIVDAECLDAAVSELQFQIPTREEGAD